MIHKTFTSVSDVLKFIPDSYAGRFSPGGWELWWNCIAGMYSDTDVEFDTSMVTEFYEYRSPEEAVDDLCSSDALKLVQEVVGESKGTLSQEDVCLGLLKGDGTLPDTLLNYNVLFAEMTPAGGVLVRTQ